MLNIETPEDFLFEDETEMERYLRSILSIDLEQFLSLWNDGYIFLRYPFPYALETLPRSLWNWIVKYRKVSGSRGGWKPSRSFLEVRFLLL